MKFFSLQQQQWLRRRQPSSAKDEKELGSVSRDRHYWPRLSWIQHITTKYTLCESEMW